MLNIYSIRSWKKKRGTDNRANLLYQIKKINKIIYVIYEQDNRRLNLYIAKKSQNYFDKNNVWQIKVWRKRKFTVQQERSWKESKEIYLIVSETISNDILWWDYKMFKMIILRIECHSS